MNDSDSRFHPVSGLSERAAATGSRSAAWNRAASPKLDRAALRVAASKFEGILERDSLTELQLQGIDHAFKVWRRNRKSVDE